MPEKPDLDDIARRPERYWNIDGLPELMIGLLWVVWGGAWLVGQALPYDWRRTTYWLVVPPTLAVAGMAMAWATQRLKERVTFPRTGYVVWMEPDRRTRLRVGATVLAVAGILALFILTKETQSIETSTPAVVTVILSLSFVVAGVRQRAPHFLALGGVAVALAIAIARLTTGWDSINWLFVTLGAVCAAVGTIRLVLFVRAHPRATAEGL